MLKIDVLSLFPEVLQPILGASILGRAVQQEIVQIACHNIRDWTTDKHNRADDYLCGGGQGMLLKPEPIFAAIAELRTPNTRVLLMTPQGRVLCQGMARAWADDVARLGDAHWIILCGHYEGVDHRVIDELVDEEVSIGDYILTNGGIAAVVVIDSVVRLLPGALGDERSNVDESFACGLLEAPAYTKPADFDGRKVPEILLSGNHVAIEKWKQEQALARTKKNRPDLFAAFDDNSP